MFTPKVSLIIMVEMIKRTLSIVATTRIVSFCTVSGPFNIALGPNGLLNIGLRPLNAFHAFKQ